MKVISSDEQEESRVFEWQKPHLLYRGGPFIPKIGENTALIVLDATSGSTLSWEARIEEAERAKKEGMKLLWELDLGLFNALKLPLSNETQFRSLGLSLAHFEETVGEKFAADSIGVVLYRGPVDFSNEIRWTGDLIEEVGEEAGPDKRALFAAEAAFNYLDSLAYLLSDKILSYAVVDAASLRDPLLLMQIASSERRSRLIMFVEGTSLPLSDLQEDSPSLALCIPSIEGGHPDFTPLLPFVLQKNLRYRIIPEPHLTAEWNGVDEMIVSSASLSSSGLRMLKGFVAAGGQVVTIGRPLGLMDELLFEEWWSNRLQSGI